MFKQARISLTLWYLMIIMIISAAFSLVIFRSIKLELDRLSIRQAIRMQNDYGLVAQPQFVSEVVEESKVRVIRTLVAINLVILVASGAGGYYLSGKTLEPISEMLHKQENFITNASHDLKTPLTAMRTSLEVALRDPLLIDQQARNQLTENLREVTNLQKLTESLLSLTRSYGINQPGLVDVGKVVRSATDELMPIVLDKKIQLSMSGTKSSYHTWGDELMLERAVVAVLDNAVKYSQSGGKIKVGVAQKGAKIIIEIRDWGVGIARNELVKVKERFYRGDKARAAGEGYGLGLSITDSILTAHKGTLTVESVKTGGTRVLISLPLSAHNQKKLS